MLITAFGSPEVEDQVRGLGATYLLKPFALQDFVAAVQSVFAEEQQGERETHVVDEMGLESSPTLYRGTTRDQVRETWMS